MSTNRWLLVGVMIALLVGPALADRSIPYTPTSGYAVRNIEGFRVLVNRELLRQHRPLARQVLRLLRYQLYQIRRVVPPEPFAKLQKIPIWVEYKAPRHPCMCYHPSRQWLQANGFNPDKQRSVEIANAENFLRWTHDQPWMVMHELAHGYHHTVLGHDNSEIRAAYEQAVASGRYEKVMHISGQMRRAYALNNDQEYFAECTEAFFGTNDFYPFVRAELAEHDPQMYRLLRKCWKLDPPAQKALAARPRSTTDPNRPAVSRTDPEKQPDKSTTPAR